MYGRACRNEQNGAKGPEAEDLQVVLSAQELEEIVGVAQLVALKHTPGFPVSFTTIKLRRCSAVGKCINFHTDFSKRTMQVALNAPDDYGGGELIFANAAGLHIPPRPVGSATIHGAGATPDCMPNSISNSRAFASSTLLHPSLLLIVLRIQISCTVSPSSLQACATVYFFSTNRLVDTIGGGCTL